MSNKTSGVVLSAAVVWMTLCACSPSTPPNTEGLRGPSGSADASTTPTEDPGNNNADAGETSDAGIFPDAGASDAGTSDAGTGVLCGTNETDSRVCTAPNVCCVTPNDAGFTAECLPQCSGGAAVSCDGPEDCSGSTPYCCFSGMLTTFLGSCFPSQIKSQCAKTCALQVPNTCSGRAQGTVCRSKADCTGNGTNTQCCPLQLGQSAEDSVTVCTDEDCP